MDLTAFNMKKYLFISLILVLFLGGCEWKFWEVKDSTQNQDQQIEEPKPEETADNYRVLEGTIKKFEDKYILSCEKITSDNISDYQLSGEIIDLLDPYVANGKVRLYGNFEGNLLTVDDFDILKTGTIFFVNDNLILVTDDLAFNLKGKAASEMLPFDGRCAEIWGKWKFEENGDFSVVSYDVTCPQDQKYSTYENSQYSFSLRYPFNWNYTEEIMNKGKKNEYLNVAFENYSEKISLTVQKDIPKIALVPEKIKKLEIQGVNDPNIYYDADMTSVIFDLPESEYDFKLSGFGEVFNNMYRTIEVMTEKEVDKNNLSQCENDFDCTTSGCSGQICQNKNEPGAVTTCEYSPEFGCYKSSACQCNNGQCTWNNETLQCVEQKLQENNSNAEKGEACGGSKNIVCKDGLTCRFDSSKTDADGVCVEIEILMPIGQEELEQGWYYGFSDQKKPETPADWIWVGAGSESKWMEK